jgi:SAM-dependent MidA family methyltransferase
MIITIDYGDRSGELYAEHRMNGTLLCYRDHRAYDDPYAFPGEQDITSHVNFDACIRTGEQTGITDWTYKSQKQFLVDAGILDRLANTATLDPFSQAARNNRMIRQLLLSDGMSELFKVLVQYKIPPNS